jgi:hypothetical protein
MPILRDHDGYFSTKKRKKKKEEKSCLNKFSDRLIHQSINYLDYDGY